MAGQRVRPHLVMPYDEHTNLVNKNISKEELEDGPFNKFVSILDDNFETDDGKYNRIVG